MSEALIVSDTPAVLVPANRLRPSEKNVRRTGKARNIEALAESILAIGLLQNLVVRVDGDTYAVDAGERRRLAIALLVERGDLPEDWPVRVCIVDAETSTAASASENIHREAMHPADQYEAFRRLAGEGWTVDRIADVFGVTPLVVERRLRLARAAPALLDLLRTDEISTEQLMALCATEDHERQESVWRNAAPWDRHPHSLRRAVLAEAVDAADPRVGFIGGVDVYRAAGGEILRDLFSGDGDGGLLTDVALLMRLVAEKLDEAAAEVRAEGWGWVEVWPQWDYTASLRLGRLTETTTPLSPEAAATVASLGEKRRTLEEEGATIGDEVDEESALSDEQTARLDAIEGELDAIDEEIARIERSHRSFAPEAMAASGAVVGIERGTLRIERGLVRAGDRPAVATAVGSGASVTGGRETAVGGRKGGELSDALTRSLYGHRNLGAQTATAANPHVAKVLLACWIVQTLRRGMPSSVPVDLRISEMGHGTRTQHPITDESGETARAAFEGIGAGLTASLPKEPDALWDALMEMEGAEIDRLIAFGVASSVSLDRRHAGLTAKLLEALRFDAADHVVATAANYLGRVSKALILDALAEAGKIPDGARRSALEAMKKGDLAAHAEAALAGTRWVPALIRTPGVPVVHVPAPTPEPTTDTGTPGTRPTGARRTASPTKRAGPAKRRGQAPAQPRPTPPSSMAAPTARKKRRGRGTPEAGRSGT